MQPVLLEIGLSLWAPLSPSQDSSGNPSTVLRGRCFSPYPVTLREDCRMLKVTQQVMNSTRTDTHFCQL